MKLRISEVEKGIAADIRLTHVATPYFAKVAKKTPEGLEDRYPNTLKGLFQVALNVVDGTYGQGLQETLPASMEMQTYPTATILKLLQEEVANSSIEMPEIIEGQGIRRNVSPVDLDGLLRLFHSYIANLTTPSHISIEMMLKQGMDERAYAEGLALKEPYEKAKAVAKLVMNDLNEHRFNRAIDLFNLIPEGVDTRNLSAHVITHLLQANEEQQALHFVQSQTEKRLQVQSLHDMAVWQAKSGQWKSALSLLDQVEMNEEESAYTLSLIINALARQYNFKEASRLAFSMQEGEFRQDALTAILRAMVRKRCITEAKQLMGELSHPQERKQAESIIESSLKADGQDKKIQAFLRRNSHMVSRSDFAASN